MALVFRRGGRCITSQIIPSSPMPCGPRLNAPGALHHVTVGGTERRPILREDTERADSLLGGLAAVLRNHTDVSVPLCG